MTFKDQWKTVKENWIIALIVLAILFVPVFSGSSGSFSKSIGGAPMYAMEEMAYASDYGSGYYEESFAPEVEERKITKTASLSTEVERKSFKKEEVALKGLINSVDGILTNENVNLYGEGKAAYYYGSYTVKVPTLKYDEFVEQLKQLGEVQSFNENARDITEQYYDVKTELEAEKSRLERYEQMYSEVKDISDKIAISDKIFDQERRVKYLQEAMENKDQQVEYSTVYFTMTEEQSNYANIAVVKFSQLIRNIVDSFNGLIQLIFWAIPWLIAIALIAVGVKFFRKSS